MTPSSESAAPWPDDTPGRFALPSGRAIVGRARSGPRTADLDPAPQFELVLAAPRERERPPWPHRVVAWPDFRLPSDPADARAALIEALERSGRERVAVSCRGGRGRTGTALACLAVLDGTEPERAVGVVRAGYAQRAVETPWQARFVRGFRTRPAGGRS